MKLSPAIVSKEPNLALALAKSPKKKAPESAQDVHRAAPPWLRINEYYS